MPTNPPAPRRVGQRIRRRRDAGVTLVEILVVLALVGITAGVVGLSLGPSTRGTGARDEAVILTARMRRASEEALLTGQPAALLWSETDYRFVALLEGAWTPHPVPLLAETRSLNGGVRFQGKTKGGYVVTAAALPADGLALALRLGFDGGDPAKAVEVTWDGAGAEVSKPGLEPDA